MHWHVLVNLLQMTLDAASHYCALLITRSTQYTEYSAYLCQAQQCAATYFHRHLAGCAAVLHITHMDDKEKLRNIDKNTSKRSSIVTVINKKLLLLTEQCAAAYSN